MRQAEERVAAAVCWLYRQPGLPTVLRHSVVERHGIWCEWCDFPLNELLELAKVPDGDPSARNFAKLPARQQREMVAKAQGADMLRAVEGRPR